MNETQLLNTVQNGCEVDYSSIFFLNNCRSSTPQKDDSGSRALGISRFFEIVYFQQIMLTFAFFVNYAAYICKKKLFIVWFFQNKFCLIFLSSHFILYVYNNTIVARQF